MSRRFPVLLPSLNTAVHSDLARLDSGKVFDTLRRLTSRIEERFPGSSLGAISRQLSEMDDEQASVLSALRKPIYLLRVLTAIGLALLAALVVWAAVVLVSEMRSGVEDWNTFFQTTESVANEFILLAIVSLFLGNLEVRYKRRIALRSLHSLRNFAHVVDMHQLTKDPVVLLSTTYEPTASSPTRSMSPIDVTRYLDYCSELLSIVGKLAALHLQYVQDPVVLESVSDLEALTQGLTNKIWQKIISVHSAS
jgi:hypothetical protein